MISFVMDSFSFKVVKKDSKTRARAGEMTTAHGTIKTPAFVPVGTKGSVRGLSSQDLKEVNAQIIFGNTYHLHLTPGEEIVKNFGGLAKFMNWGGSTITDSGGFQVFSLGKKKIKLLEDLEDTETEASLVKITEDGVEFRSHIDGSKHIFTPETSIEIQKKLGADIILAFDECAPHPSTHEYAKKAMERTHKWAIRCLRAFRSISEESKATSEALRSDSSDGGFSQALYGIVQGGVYKDLREESAKFIRGLDFDGIAIGGVSVGESKKQMRDVLDWTVPFLPEEKPKHLLGIGEVDDIFAAVERGMDAFDCVIPTRFGRYGIIFVPRPEGNLKNKFRLDIKKAIYAKDQGALAKDCNCYVCQNFTRGYVNHLFKARELLAYRLASYHNLYFIINLVDRIRESILNGSFQRLKKNWLS